METQSQHPAFVYMLRCEGDRLYTGWTDDPPARLYAHKNGQGGAKFTHAFPPEGFAYLEQLADKSAALKREAAIKKLPKAKKEALCASWAENRRPRLSVATQADTADILSLYNWYVENSRATFQITPSTLPQYEKWVAGTLAVAPMLLARDGAGRLMGFACVHRWHEREAFDWDREITIYCAPDARGMGVGNALYPPLLEMLRQQGVWNVYALIADPNPASEAFHQKYGFVCEGRTPHTGYKLGKWIGLSTWHLALRKGNTAPKPLTNLTQQQVQEILEKKQKARK